MKADVELLGVKNSTELLGVVTVEGSKIVSRRGLRRRG